MKAIKKTFLGVVLLISFSFQCQLMATDSNCPQLIRITIKKYIEAEIIIKAKILQTHKDTKGGLEKWSIKIIEEIKGIAKDTFYTNRNSVCATSTFKEGDIVIIYARLEKDGVYKEKMMDTFQAINSILKHKEKHKTKQIQVFRKREEKLASIELNLLRYYKEAKTDQRLITPTIQYLFPYSHVNVILGKGTVTSKYVFNKYRKCYGKVFYVQMTISKNEELISYEVLNKVSKKDKLIIKDFVNKLKFKLVEKKHEGNYVAIEAFVILKRDYQMPLDF